MSYIKDSIKKALNDKDEISKKIITVNVEEDTINTTDKIIKVLSDLGQPKSFSRNSVFEIALKAFNEESTKMLLEEFSIDLNTVNINDDEIEMFDLAIFPAHNDGFEEVFLGERKWYAVRIKDEKIPHIRFIALYRAAPVSGITHYAKVSRIETYDNTNKKIIYFEEPKNLGKTIRLGNSDANSMRSPRYTTKEKLLQAAEIKDLFN